MGELSPKQLEETRLKEVEKSKINPYNSALDVIEMSPHKVKVSADARSERYQYKKWVVSDSINEGGYSMDRGEYRLGYPVIRGSDEPLAIHIIFDENFGYPWATIIPGAVEWTQEVDSVYSDAVMSDRSQRFASTVVSRIRELVEAKKIHKRKITFRSIGIAAIALTLVGGIASGLSWNSNRIDHNDAVAAAAATAIAAFDAQWAEKPLTEQPIVEGAFSPVSEGSMPSGIPLAKTSYSSEKSLYTPEEPMQEGMIREFELSEGCSEIQAELVPGDTISVLVEPTIDSIVAVPKPETDTVKICISPVNHSLGRMQQVALQITPRT